ncbi:amidase signature enzyme [Pseudovirgaria hyperparasitica]|uniref:Glutamyl-tRNA(Gln) amidotransferase subunit A, mitochondrial n=1 Tax=Pseudovirgaria hyperparasitica TaxID=470096 RepID=A0A6A6WGZ1_9PEZI|nr:amidase signature enzyme [Pseudovirgaria hyperparasitica]KAF2761355.1 amidase signature enzyme [Pseudovirgaria hyperparasitica]
MLRKFRIDISHGSERNSPHSMLRSLGQKATLLQEAEKALVAQSAFKSLNAFISVPNADILLREVAEHEAAPAKGPLSGKLIAVKDNICTSSLPTTAGSRLLRHFTSPYDATIIEKLRASGAVIAGKTNLDEFGMGSHSTHSHFGPVSQVSASGQITSVGGSSGGSAVAVATGQCHAAVGTDTGGSVRLPAAYNNVVGFKPSYGLVSRWGVIAYANSLDTVGVFGRNLGDTRIMFDALNAFDARDPTSLSEHIRARMRSNVCMENGKDVVSLRVGVPTDYNIDELDTAVKNAWITTLQALQGQGATLVPVELQTTRHALSAYYVLAPAEVSSNLAKYDGVRYGERTSGPDGTSDSVLFAKTRGELGAEAKRRILLGAYSLSAEAKDNYFIQAQKVRKLVQDDFNKAFRKPNPLYPEHRTSNAEGVDVLICPTAPTPPPELERLRDQQPVDAYTNDVFTVPASLAGLPALSMPVGGNKSNGIGIQVIGQFGDDHLVFDVAERIEECT